VRLNGGCSHPPGTSDGVVHACLQQAVRQSRARAVEIARFGAKSPIAHSRARTCGALARRESHKVARVVLSLATDLSRVDRTRRHRRAIAIAMPRRRHRGAA
jgi:hypothetical protein